MCTRPSRQGLPASVRRSVALLHGASFIMALLLVVVLIIPQTPELMELVAAGAVNPTRSIEPDAIRIWKHRAGGRSSFHRWRRGLSLRARARPHRASARPIIATFSTSDEAGRAFDEVQQEAPASGRLVCFGQSLLLSLPASDEATRTRWFDDFEGRAEELFR